MNIQKIIILFVFTLFSHAIFAEEVVGQKDKKFSMASLTVNVGDSVSFKNEDAFFHNVFSLSDAQMFDLGSYPQGESKSVIFDTAGTVEVECAIHPSMQMIVTVK
ncbi:MAG: plastocyanin/azurin family copper-binding protein [Methylococcaceae bacterium]